MLQRDDGFTLIEVLVAFAILATVSGAVYVVFSDGLQRTQSNEQWRTAAMHARSKLAVLGKGMSLEDEPRSGAFDERFVWSLSVGDYGDDADRENWPIAPKLITLTVSWTGAVKDHSFTVSTLRLTRKP